MLRDPLVDIWLSPFFGRCSRSVGRLAAACLPARCFPTRARFSRQWILSLGCIALLFCCGCTNKAEDTSIDNPPDLDTVGSGAMASDIIGPSTAEQSVLPPDQSQTPERTGLDPMGSAGGNAATSMDPTADFSPGTPRGIVGQTDQPFESPLTLAPSNDPIAESKSDDADAADTEDRLQLRPDLSPDDLIGFLSQADQYLQLLMSGRGITDPRESFQEMNRVAKSKLEASRRLANHPDADARQRSEGTRGEMQSLSHLAAQGNLEAAEELSALAKTHMESSDPQLVDDSRLVLIGFAIEALQAGKKNAADEIVSLVESVDSNDAAPDVPALMMMGHARSLLARYEFDEQAVKVRQRILDLFADSSNPEIAKMAAQAAGNVRFDAIEKLRSEIVAGKNVDTPAWSSAVTELIDEAPDLVSVQYLAGAALEFEAVGADDLASVTYQIVGDRFDDPETATGREIELALQARAARERVIGNIYAPSLPSTSGASMPLSDYDGKVILMPFWASGFRESLQIIPLLKAVQKEFPNEVAIVGMNLDPSGARVDEFEPDKQLGFPSYRSESSASESGGNPVAAQFGMVSMPFVAILDQQQRVIALDFTGKKIKRIVQKLLQK